MRSDLQKICLLIHCPQCRMRHPHYPLALLCRQGRTYRLSIGRLQGCRTLRQCQGQNFSL